MELDRREWLETDGLGGLRDRAARRRIRDAALPRAAASARRPPTGAHGAGRTDSKCSSRPAAGRFALSSQRYRGRRHPPGRARAASLRSRTSRGRAGASRLEDGTRVEHEIASRHGRPRVVLRWRAPCRCAGPRALLGAAAAVGARPPRAAPRERRLPLRRARSTATRVRWRPYDGRAGDRRASRTAVPPRAALVPQLRLRRGGGARPRLRRGPRVARRAVAFDLDEARPALVARSRRMPTWSGGWPADARRAAACAERARRDALRVAARARRRRLPRARAAAARRSSPAIRGSPTGAATPSSRCAGCAWRPGRLEDARGRSCSEWAGAISRGHAAEPLRRVGRAARVQLGRRRRCGTSIAVDELLGAARRARPRPGRPRTARGRACVAILAGYVAGTRHGIRARRRRAARGRRARRAAHLDGRQGRRPRGHAAHRQAGRGAGAVDQRAGRSRGARDAR